MRFNILKELQKLSSYKININQPVDINVNAIKEE